MLSWVLWDGGGLAANHINGGPYDGIDIDSVNPIGVFEARGLAEFSDAEVSRSVPAYSGEESQCVRVPIENGHQGGRLVGREELIYDGTAWRPIDPVPVLQ